MQGADFHDTYATVCGQCSQATTASQAPAPAAFRVYVCGTTTCQP
jgi:hypothetical protein